MNSAVLQQDAFTELDTINAPIDSDDYGITTLNYNHFLAELHNRSSYTIKTTYLIPFINTLGRNKSGGNNAIARLQYFLNAYIQEIALKSLNSDCLDFISQDHHSLIRGNTGTDDPDFCFFTSQNTAYTIDVKIFYSRAKYDKHKATTNFHKADYCLVYLIDTKTWRFGKKSENYSILYATNTLAITDPHLAELKLPDSLTLIRFFTDELNSFQFRAASDADVPEMVNYEFYV